MRIGLVGLGRIGVAHAATLRGLDAVETLVVADVDRARADALATEPDVEALAPEEILEQGRVDGLVVATGSAAHADWVRRAIAAGVPTFCEKPLATTLAETITLADEVLASGVPVHVGFQRRFDAGFRAARDAVASGELGFVHTVRTMTSDRVPPPAEFIATSGGIFRDCVIHDADSIRFVTGREVVSVYAVGGTKGAPHFAESGDVDTGAAVLTLDDGTVALLSTSRYNGAGQDVRMEVAGERGTIGVGYDDSLPLRSAEPGARYPAGPVKADFFERLHPAFVAEMAAFVEMVAGRVPPPASVADAAAAARVVEACDLSLREGRPVLLDEIPGAPARTATPVPAPAP